MSRVWEIEDRTVLMPVDMVREQDFILRLRRLQRQGAPFLIANLVLSALPALAKSSYTLETVQARLREFAKGIKGTYVEMSNGDVFLIWDKVGAAGDVIASAVKLLPLEEGQAQNPAGFLATYTMPDDYTKLRERANHYIDVVRDAVTQASGTPAAALKGENARGPLTAWGVDQIGKLLEDIDVRTYARTQPIYRLNDDNTWQAISEEYFISLENLRRERFPKLDLTAPEHLFLALCEMVDQRLLSLLAKANATIVGRALHINLAVATVIDNVFAQFTHSIPKDQRGLLTFELHCGDIFQDFSRTQTAIDVLRREKFRVVLDGVTPDMLPYVNLAAFRFDMIKINVSGDRISLFNDAAVRKALQALPPDKLLFFRCDSDKALQISRSMGVRLFQGWHIDELANPRKK